jgi:hypothetical protein
MLAISWGSRLPLDVRQLAEQRFAGASPAALHCISTVSLSWKQQIFPHKLRRYMELSIDSVYGGYR